jgi:DNA polymerase-3 subunit alpha
MAGRYVHLHTHSHYSFLQALPKVDELVAKAKKEGMPALGLTDNGNLHGAVELYQECKDAGIKAVIGVDAYIAPRSRFDRDQATAEKRTRLVLLAENNEGYKNLMTLVTKSFTEGFFDRPLMDKELIKEHAAGIIALMPSFAGDVPRLLGSGQDEAAGAALAEWSSIFGKNNLFLEITRHPGAAGHEEKMRKVIELSKKSGCPLVAQQDVYYLAPGDREATSVMRRIQHGGADRNEEEDFSFISEKEMHKRFKGMEDAVDRSTEIAERCNVTLTLGSWVFPDFPTDKGKTHGDMLRDKAYRGLSARGLSKDDPEVAKRLEYELDIIIDKGFAPYFLVVSDLLTFAKNAGILTTTRGSAAGSLVSYATGITNVDPLAYKLPFERFLNPERPKAPDIDMDYADTRRDEMIAYAKQKYGEDKVAQIGTFGTMMARAAVRDVARALGHSYGTGDRIAKLIPIGQQGFPMTIERAFKEEPELKALYEEDEDAHEILDLAMRIEGSVRHTGVHAAGVVIAPTPLTEWTPLQTDPKTGKLITQYDMHAVEDAGLLKYDFLGIKNLSILADAMERVRDTRGIMIDIENIPLDDPKTFAMLARGETEGTFQLNGSGMTRYLKELKPTTIHDINAMVALYRPGPMETIPQYIERKHNPALIHYMDPRMKDYLDASYGLLVYQDDVLLTAITLGGYSWLEADTLRKAMGKKIPKEMEAQKEKLIKGFIEFGKLSPEKAKAIWALIEPFAAYGFNKAHAASYGKVAYQTAYMKANYPVEYMAALLTADAGDTESIATLVGECERLHIPVLPPDVNESGSVFTITGENKNTIRFGLSSIKNFGEGISEAILAERMKNGPYTSISDFLTRVGSRNLNRKSLESLIKAGALDSFANRGTLMANIDRMVEFHRDASKESSQDSLFGALAAPTLSLTDAPDLGIAERLAAEKELLGIYVSGHPLDAHTATLERAKLTISAVKADPQKGRPIIIPVLIAEVRTVLTKSGEKMAFVKFEDKSDSIEGVIFPKLYRERGQQVVPGVVLLLKATISNRNGEVSLAVDNLKVL